ncbi:MAG TPA: hypothetical protein VE219_01820, partial [Candidatus Sulfotelmatobacter sp.]|nr:hypothetical protein [Candidatus Sulfotelmatobacter sp.]
MSVAQLLAQGVDEAFVDLAKLPVARTVLGSSSSHIGSALRLDPACMRRLARSFNRLFSSPLVPGSLLMGHRTPGFLGMGIRAG